MPAGEIAGELLGVLFRFVGHLFLEVVFEVLVKGAGYIICRPFYRRVNPDGFLVIVVGLAFWALLGWLLYMGYSFMAQQIAIDDCLDSGGRYNYVSAVCAGVEPSSIL